MDASDHVVQATTLPHTFVEEEHMRILLTMGASAPPDECKGCVRTEDVTALVNMGVHEDRARWALESSSGDLVQAVELATAFPAFGSERNAAGVAEHAEDADVEATPSSGEEVDLLVSMGVDRDLARWALSRTSGDIDAAADLATSSEANAVEELVSEEFSVPEAAGSASSVGPSSSLVAVTARRVDDRVETLVSMGIKVDVARWALSRTGSDVEAAADLATSPEAADYAPPSSHIHPEPTSAEVASDSALDLLVARGVDRDLARWSLAKCKGDVEAAAVLAASLDKATVHVPGEPVPERKEDSKDVQLLKRWVEKRDEDILPEYWNAAAKICVAPELMRRSRLARCLVYLQDRQDGIGIDEILLKVVQKAYGLRSAEAARNHSTDVVGLASGNVFQGALTTYNALGWQQPYLVTALVLLFNSEDPQGLQVVLGLLHSGAEHCFARKTYAFNAVLGRVVVPTETSSGSLLDADRAAVLEVATELVEDVKDQALKTTFLEPTKMYFRAHNNPVMERNVEVHGMNTYLAVLMATLGVQFNRLPELGDILLGVADFLDGQTDEAMEVMWADEHFGHDWQNIQELRAKWRGDREPKIFELVGNLAHVLVLQNLLRFEAFIFRGSNAREVAIAASNPRGSSSKRWQMAKYLEQFAHWFSEDFLVPRMITRLTGDGGRLSALQTLKEDLVLSDPSFADENDDVRFWLWDMDAFPAQLRMHRACALLRRAGVLRRPPCRRLISRPSGDDSRRRDQCHQQ